MEMFENIALAEWSAAFVNSLPDTSFAYVAAGGEKETIRGHTLTKPRSLRHLPYKDASGKSDKAHIQNALARLSQTDIPASAKASARRKLLAAAKETGMDVAKYDEPMGLHPEPDGDEETPLDYASRGQQYDIWEALWGCWQCFCETYQDITGDNDADNIPHLPILLRSIAQFHDDVSALLEPLGLVEKLATPLAELWTSAQVVRQDLSKAGAPMAGHRLTRLRDAIQALQQILEECTPPAVEHAGLAAAEVVTGSKTIPGRSTLAGSGHVPYLVKGARAMALRKNAESDKEHCDNCTDKDCDNAAHDRMKNLKKQEDAAMEELAQAQEELAQVQTTLAKTQQELLAAQAALAARDATIAKMQQTPEEQEAAYWASVPESIRKAHEADQVEKAALRAEIQQAREEKERVVYMSKALDYRGIGFVPDKHWSILKALDAIPDDEVRTEVYRLLKAAAEQLRTSSLFSAFGSPGHGAGAVETTGSASDQLMAMTKAMQDEKGLDFAKASEVVAKAHPTLYQQMIQERRRAARVAAD